MPERIQFQGIDGVPLVGNLHLPEEAHRPSPGVVLIGPMTFCKEQSPTAYATRLALLGYAALTFDPRFRGESGGEPRCWENPTAKVEDLKCAVDCLVSRPDVDSRQIAGLAICQGASEMLRAVADDARIRVLATVAGHYRDHDGDVEWLTEEGIRQRLETGKTARRKFEETGIPDYVPAVDKTRMDVGMPGELPWSWYQSWADHGVWENRYAVMSDADLLSYESISAAKQIRTPWLMVHSDQCFIPSAAKRHFDAAATPHKRLEWEEGDVAPELLRPARRARSNGSEDRPLVSRAPFRLARDANGARDPTEAAAWWMSSR